ncbi:TPA: mobilization protein, partial [Escherichia coli]|nr:mobilization protein [Escherichia coli]
IPVIDQDMLFELRRLGALQKHLFLEGGRVGDKEYSEVIVALRECADALKKRIGS